MLFLLLSFLAGVLTILAPCVLPVLPVVIGGSLSTTKRGSFRPYVITASLAASIIGFTLLLKVSTWLINLPPSALTIFSGFLVIILGLISVVPEAWEKFMITVNWQAASQRLLGKGEQNKGKYIGPILIGLALGPVFASCSPTYAFILASVLPHSFAAGLLYLTAYSLGLVMTLLAGALAGRKYISRFPWAIDTHSWFRRGIGALFVLIGFVIISGNQVSVEIWVASNLPFDESKLEQTLLSSGHKPVALNKSSNGITQSGNSSVLNVASTAAPEFQELTGWINSPALQLSQLKDKVVLVDFWTYSCINCIRTIPYIEKWYETYQKDGFVVVGVNTPEFAFEHNPANVRAAVKKYGITYPVALDNSYSTWNAYANNSWPADYLIDKAGNIRYQALGEGDYDKTERAIQSLLAINRSLRTPTYTVPITSSQTPETYFGGNRQTGFSGTLASTPSRDGSYAVTPTPPGELQQNSWTLSGNWHIEPQSITSAGSNAILTFNITSKDVYMVAGSSDGRPVPISLSLADGSKNQFGADDPNGIVQVSGSRLYHIVSLKQLGTTTVTLHLLAGITLYTFTFGS